MRLKKMLLSSKTIMTHSRQAQASDSSTAASILERDVGVFLLQDNKLMNRVEDLPVTVASSIGEIAFSLCLIRGTGTGFVEFFGDYKICARVVAVDILNSLSDIPNG